MLLLGKQRKDMFRRVLEEIIHKDSLKLKTAQDTHTELLMSESRGKEA
jgi:hypothetical protein